MKEVISNLFIGDKNDYFENVEGKDGWVIIHACKEPFHRNLLGYTGRGAPKGHPEYLFAIRENRMYMNIVDADNYRFFDKGMVNASLDFINENLQENKKVLIHCNQGQSRSSFLGFLYLIKNGHLRGADLPELMKEFMELYPKTLMAKGVSDYIKLYWKEYYKSNN